MLRLTLALRARIDITPTMSLFWQALASTLAADLKTLSSHAENEVVPCSRVLRDVVRNTAALFAPTTGGLEVTTDIEYVRLPAYKRRALVLLASELVVNALLHAYSGRCSGRYCAKLAASERRQRSPLREG